MPEQTDGLIKGFQLWLNLPKEKKMISPKYNDIDVGEIPVVDFMNAKVKIISGELSGVKGPGKPHTGMLYFDISLNAGSDLILPIENGWNSFIYVYVGSDNILDKQISKSHLAVLNQEGDLKLHSKEEAKFILVAGEPLNEPVARGGPFVMNTKGEVLQAFSDYQEGRFA